MPSLPHNNKHARLKVRFPCRPLPLPCRVRGALAVHPSFEAGMHSMRAFFEVRPVASATLRGGWLACNCCLVYAAAQQNQLNICALQPLLPVLLRIQL